MNDGVINQLSVNEETISTSRGKRNTFCLVSTVLEVTNKQLRG